MPQNSSSKVVSLSELVRRVSDGSSLALGGSFLHRGPFSFVRELIRQKKTALEIIKQSPGYDIDILCRARCVSKLRAGIVAMEGNFGLAPSYRKAVEKSEIVLEEHACASLTAGLRAAAFGVPFQPCGGLHGSDLTSLNEWVAIRDPYGSNKEVWIIPAIAPDYAVIHVNEANEQGDVRVFGTYHWDRIMTRAAKRVLIVTERLCSMESFRMQPELTLVPHFMVEAIAVVPGGGWPGSCWPLYEIDYPAVQNYLAKPLQEHIDRAPEAGQSIV
jgi:glutaconate CoA-transferase, subunit A